MYEIQEVNEFILKTFRLLRVKMPAMQAFQIQSALKIAYLTKDSEKINFSLAKIEEKLLKVYKDDEQKKQEIKDLFLDAPRLPELNNNEDDIFRFDP